LATIRDNGLCPCPRCLMPKTHLDRMGWILDSTFRISGIRQFLYKKVQTARNLVYRVGHAVAGAGVNGLLKITSSVPTMVREVPFHSWLGRFDPAHHRTHSVNDSGNLGKNSIFCRCWLLTFYTSSSLVFGRRYLLTLSGFSTLRLNGQVHWQTF
jgi:hypothetical protein